MEIDSLEIRIETSVNKANKALDELDKKLEKAEKGMKEATKAAKGIDFSQFSKFSKNTIFPAMDKLNQKLSLGNLNFKKLEKNMKSNTRSLTSFAKGVAGLGASFAGLKKTIDEASDSIETINYFNAAFGQVAEKAVGQWEEAGYQSAEAYANSFVKRAAEVTGKLTGYTPSENGTLQTTKSASLGLNPSQVMNYQAMFAQMASSIGVSGENALKLSHALTMIGADLASIKNMDFDKVWTDMASGLAGMSRTLDKYGVNIRNVNLQERLHQLGISANIQTLNQQDKALLRGIILLDSTRFAWGDLAKTLDTPANQLRLLTANMNNLARTIGNLFLPVLAKVLPYINGFVIALQRLFTWVGSMLNIDFSKFNSGNKGVDNSGISDLLDNTDSLGGSLGTAANEAKKLKTHLLGIDELNVVQPDDELSGGLLGGLGDLSGLSDAFGKLYDEYLEAWERAFAELENKAEKIADKIAAFAKKIFKPISAAWEKEGQFVIDSWTWGLEKVGELTKAIGSDLMEVWQQEETVRIFENIFHIVGDIGKITGHLAENFKNAWIENERGLQILQNIRDGFGIISEKLREIADHTVAWAEKLDFAPLLESVLNFSESMKPAIEGISGIFADFYNQVILPLGSWVIGEGLPQLVDVFTKLNNNIDWEALRGHLSEFWTHLEPFAETVGQGLIDFMDKIGGYFADFVNSSLVIEFLSDFSDWMDNIDPSDVTDGIEKLASSFVTLKISLVAFEGIKNLSGLIENLAKLKQLFSSTSAEAEQSKPVLNEADSAAQKSASSMDNASKSASVLTAGIVGMGASVGIVESIGRIWEQHFGPSSIQTTSDFVLALNKLNEQYAEGKIGAEEYSKKLGDLSIKAQDAGIAVGEDFVQKMESITLEDAGKNVSEGFFKGVNDNIAFGIASSVNQFSQYISEVENVLGVHSPSVVFAEIGKNVVTGFINGINDTWMLAAESIQLFSAESWALQLENIKLALQTKWGEISEWWKEFALNLWWVEDVQPWFSIEKWQTELNNIKESFRIVWGDTAKQWQVNISKWWINDVATWFALEKWATLLRNIETAFDTSFSSVKNIVSGKMAETYQIVADYVDSMVSKIGEISAALSALSSVNITGSISVGAGIQGFASGGFPERSSLFFAGEHGIPEILGTVGGRTAVAGGDEITGIRQAVYDTGSAETALMETMISLLQVIAEKETSFEVDGRELLSAVNDRQNRSGFSFAT